MLNIFKPLEDKFVLHLLSEFETEEDKKFISKYLIDRKNHSLKMINKNGTALHAVCRSGQNNALKNLIAELSKDTNLGSNFLADEICKRVKGDTPLDALVRSPNSDDSKIKYIRLLLKNKNLLKTFFSAESNIQWGFMHNVARECSSHDLKFIIQYIANLDKAILVAMLTKKDDDSMTPVGIAMHNHSYTTMLWLCNFIKANNMKVPELEFDLPEKLQKRAAS